MPRLFNAKGAFNKYVDKKRGRRGQQKVHACPPSLNVQVDQNLTTYLRRYFILLCTVMGGKKAIKLH